MKYRYLALLLVVPMLMVGVALYLFDGERVLLRQQQEYQSLAERIDVGVGQLILAEGHETAVRVLRGYQREVNQSVADLRGGAAKAARKGAYLLLVFALLQAIAIVYVHSRLKRKDI